MKRIISCLAIVCLLMCGFVMSSSAADDGVSVAYTFVYGDKEITVESSELSYEEMKAIADVVAGVEPENEASPCGIWCLFGHNLTTSYVTEVTHNAYTTSPKCLQNKYQVESCTRSSCDYAEKTLLTSTRISTCHG